jgi:hypothetical protein
MTIAMGNPQKLVTTSITEVKVTETRSSILKVRQLRQS